MTNKEVARAFAGMHKARGHNGKNNYHFEGLELYSYAALIAVILKPGWAWVSSRRWSNTTSRHQSLAHFALLSNGYYVLMTENCPKPHKATLLKLKREQQERLAQEVRDAEKRTVKREQRLTKKRELEALSQAMATKHEEMTEYIEPQSDTDKGFSTRPPEEDRPSDFTPAVDQIEDD